jgi:hypothetical protein
MSALAWVSLGCAALPGLLFIKNLSLYRPPEAGGGAAEAVSVLIPARDEETNIAAAVRSVLANRGVELEVVVLDDHSTDRTAEIVRAISASDSRVRLEQSPELPAGWCGKQHACWVLAQHARYPVLVFVDADVRLSRDALARFDGFLAASGADLISGVPRQVTETPLEKLLIPLIHFVLLGFLPVERMRKDLSPSLGAGCGQLFIARKEPYFESGGHRAIRESMHDGIRLPRAFRSAGFRTDLFDATPVATCRMYSSAREVWRGLGKNATEGLGSARLIGPMTLLLFCGQVLPWLLLVVEPASIVAWSAAAFSLLPRVLAAIRFKQSIGAALLQPLSVLLLLVIQWQAFFRKLSGRRTEWRGRSVTSAGT